MFWRRFSDHGVDHTELALPFSHLPTTIVQSVLDVLPTPIFYKDRAGRYLGCNLAFAAFLNTTVQNIIGKTVFDLVPTEAAQTLHEADMALMANGQTLSHEAHWQMPCCDDRDVVFYKAALHSPAGEVIGVAGVVVDITERKALEMSLSRLANADSLTGLLNRRAILAQLERRHADRRQASQTLCLLMCDVDHFKTINDRFGHATGDEALRQVAQTLRQHLRDGDHLGRIGGEEFLVVLGSADLNEALLVAERLRLVVSQLQFDTQQGPQGLTMSVGLAQSATDENWPDLLSRADEALYSAKRDGRNRVAAAQVPLNSLTEPFWPHI